MELSNENQRLLVWMVRKRSRMASRFVLGEVIQMGMLFIEVRTQEKEHIRDGGGFSCRVSLLLILVLCGDGQESRSEAANLVTTG